MDLFNQLKWERMQKLECDICYYSGNERPGGVIARTSDPLMMRFDEGECTLCGFCAVQAPLATYTSRQRNCITMKQSIGGYFSPFHRPQDHVVYRLDPSKGFREAMQLYRSLPRRKPKQSMDNGSSDQPRPAPCLRIDSDGNALYIGRETRIWSSLPVHTTSTAVTVESMEDLECDI